MELREFVALVPGFAQLSQTDQILHFGWYLHTQRGMESFDQAAIRSCYEDRHMDEPNLSLLFKRLAERRPKVLLASGSKFLSESKVRAELDKKYGQHESTIAVSQMLKDLIGKVPDQAEQLFLSEAIKCYHVRAFRGAIVMAWNLAYDHLLNWILSDATRLADFNSKILSRVGAKRGAGLVIAKREDFEELREQEVLDICNSASLFASGNTKKLLDIQLTKRNLAAHPSPLAIGAGWRHVCELAQRAASSHYRRFRLQRLPRSRPAALHRSDCLWAAGRAPIRKHRIRHAADLSRQRHSGRQRIPARNTRPDRADRRSPHSLRAGSPP